MNKTPTSSSITTTYCLKLRNNYQFNISYYWFSALEATGLLKIIKQEARKDKRTGIETIKIIAKLRYKLDQLCSVFIPKDHSGQIKIEVLRQYQEPVQPSWYVCPLGQLIKQFGRQDLVNA